MSIASRITSIEGHIGDIYDSVELTGVDTTDIDKNLVNVPNTLKEGYIDILNNGTDTLYNNFPKVSGEGASLTLNNTYQAPMRNNLKGNTSQTGTPTPTSPIPVNVVSGDNEIEICGKNLLDTTKTAQTYAGVTYKPNADGSITITGTSTAGGTVLIVNQTNPPILEAGTYTRSVKTVGSVVKNSNYVLLMGRNNNGTNVLGDMQINENSTTTKTTTTTDTNTMSQIGIYVSGAGAEFNCTLYIQLEKNSTATDYIPYDKNEYNVDLPVENLFKEWLSGTVNTQTGEITSVARNRSDYIYVEPSTIYNLWREDTGFATYLIEYNENKAFIQEQHLSSNVTSGTFTTSATTKFVILFQYTNYSPTNKAQLTKGSKLYPYTPYGSAIELCKIGTYQDYFYKDSDKWYLHKEIGKVTYNGTENWTTFAINYEYQIILQDAKEGDFENQFFPSLCNKYVNHNVGGASLNNYEFSNFTSGVYRWIRIRHNDITTLANYKTWLASNTPTFYYLLATPTNTEITDTTLINQLEELYIAKSKENQTNISQINNDLPFIISASALKKGV